MLPEETSSRPWWTITCIQQFHAGQASPSSLRPVPSHEVLKTLYSFLDRHVTLGSLLLNNLFIVDSGNMHIRL